MSHNKIIVDGKAPSASSEIELNISDIGSFTSSGRKLIGFDGNGALVQLNPSLGINWIPTYHYYGKYISWSGGGSLSIGDRLAIRKASGILNSNGSYVSDLFNGSSNATWANQFVLQPGTYLLNGSFSGRIRSASDECILRVKNETDNTSHGNHAYWGASQYSNNMYAYVTITAPKTFSFMIEALNGSPNFITYITLMYVHLNIWRLA